MSRRNFKLYTLITLLLLLTGSISYRQNQRASNHIQNKAGVPSKKAQDSTFDFDSLMVIHFHPTAQCSCCINVGNFSKKALEKFYSKPYKDKRIIFRECNIDEDSLTAKKYQIFWSALGFAKMVKGKEEFKEIESVWTFCEEEHKFLINFQKELNSFIAGKKEVKIKKTAK